MEGFTPDSQVYAYTIVPDEIFDNNYSGIIPYSGSILSECSYPVKQGNKALYRGDEGI